MSRRVAVVVSTALFVLLVGQAAFAGEWSPGKGEHNGAPDHANSDCVFNGQDDPDVEDDALWALTPAKGRVQSGGQMIAAIKQGVDLSFLPPEETPFPGVQRFACNGHLAPRK